MNEVEKETDVLDDFEDFDDTEGINSKPMRELRLIMVTKKKPRIHVVTIFVLQSCQA